MRENPGELIYILTGPSACGKTTLLDAVVKGYYFNSSGEKEELPEGCRNYCREIRKIVTSTTRKPRPGEIDGVHYKFFTREQFNEEKEKGNILEETFYAGNFYGTPRSEVDKILKAGLDGIIALDRNGVGKMKKIYGEDKVISIFIYRELDEILKELRERKTSEEELKSRYESAKEELKAMTKCDYTIKNTGTLEESVFQLCEIIKKTIDGSI